MGGRMKKKLISIILILSLLTVAVCGCRKNKDRDRDRDREDATEPAIVQADVVVAETSDPVFTAEEWLSMQPQEIQIRNICQLATLEVYFHNVAKAEKPAASGMSGTGQEDRRFWFEYSGSARVGIDMSQVTITITGNTVTVRIPHATILGTPSIDSDSYDLSSVIIEPDNSWAINPNQITAEDLTNAVGEANIATRDELSNDSSLMMRAENRAIGLIRSYIEQISVYSDVEYTFEWYYIETE